MRFRITLTLAAFFLVSIGRCNDTFAQGTRSDYERAAKVQERFNVAQPNSASYQWIDGDLLLKLTSDGTDKYQRFDGQTGERTEGAAIQELYSSKDLKPRRRPGKSASSNEPTEITFKNTLNYTVQVYWSDYSASLKPYGSVASGKSMSLSTYVGHQWVVRQDSDKPVGVFEATARPGVAVIDDVSRRIANTSEDASKRRKPQSQQDEPNTNSKRSRLSIQDHNVILVDSNGDEKPLTTNGTKNDRYLDRFHYSPDRRYALVFQETKVDKRRIPLVQSTPRDQLQPTIEWLDYVKPGDELAQRRPQLFDLEKQVHIKIDEEQFLDSWSVRFRRWSPDGTRAYVMFNRRGHQQLALRSIHIADGKVQDTVNEQSQTFVDYSQKTMLHWLDQSDELIWASERDGWNHLYRVNAKSGEVVNQVTKGNWVVRNIEYIDEQNQVIWFTAMGIHPDQDPYHHHLARVNFDGSELTVLTQGDGTHKWEFNADRSLFVDRWSRVDQPEVWELRRTSDGSRVAELYRRNIDALTSAGFRPPIRFAVPGRDGKTMIYGHLIQPSNFDPKLQYPVIESIYAGPHGQHVRKSFGKQIRERRLTELGFVVAQIDGMGTNWRSKAFHDVCWQNLKDAGFPDRIAWLKAAAKQYSWLNISRVGIYGGSAGGQNALSALLHHGEFYQAAASDCGCHDNRMDKIWWNEAWMGKVGPHYEENSNTTHAGKLRGDLQLTVGELDKNVDPASTMQVVDALIRADKDFEFVIVPGGGHGIGESKYLFRRRQDFFVRSLLGVEPRTSP